ncbi:Mitochondrial chaperone Frataxin [Coniochaeta pulveracea]|uniref:ferroxidase n=1 Tax=Coniochaeta pulveracea TaxID=177199 RepID=A0A420YA47_9PEZI|nr:Mitochondrial chaperone Frataxin [Coniochaeta pulveracea]
MFRPANLTRLARAASRGTHISRVARAAVTAASRSSFGSRHIHATSTRPIAILEDRDRKPKASERSPVSVAASDITEAEYHQLADEYLETLLSKFEELQDAREDVDVEFSAGVMTVNFGPEVGTYVINKQPPNKQIWLSSPKSGPKRFDWCIIGDGQNQKAETAVGEWVCGRDGSTLSRIFLDELDVDLGMPASTFGK